tara:strand:- start:112 stop:1026 length:915 start_codon:yes stop_codon:yes gene_type:complete
VNFKHIVIIGAGTMGTDLSVKLAASGTRVTIVGRPGGQADTFHNRARNAGLDLSLDFDQLKLQLLPDLISVDWPSADLIIENVNEDLALKQSIFGQVVILANANAIIASNSSTFGISLISSGLAPQARFFGLHFFMPAHLVPLVEIVTSEHSDVQIAEKIKLYLSTQGFVPVIVRKDVPGFLANRIQAAMMREVWNILERGIATPEDVDKAVTYGFGCRFLAAGPVMQKEMSGLDITCSASKNVFPDLSNEDEPPKILSDKVERGEMGMKTGLGFWSWNDESISEARNGYVAKLKAAIKILSDS